MPNTVKVLVPDNPQELIILMKKVIAKHTADGAKSPLAPLNMADFAAKLQVAEDKDKETSELQRASTKATEARNLALGIDKAQSSFTEGTALNYLKGCRDVLLGVYKGREYSLGDWGFDVSTSSKPSASKPDSPAAGLPAAP